MKISLQRALLLLLGGVVLVALVPGGLLLDRRLSLELERQAREELAVAPRLLADWNAARSDALMMHAKDVAAAPAVIAAFRAGDPETAVRAAEAAQIVEREGVVAVAASAEEPWAGPMPAESLLAATRTGEMPVYWAATETGPARLALAPVKDGDVWLGAAGVYEPLDATGAAALAGLSGSGVAVLAPGGGVAVTTLDTARAASLVRTVPGPEVREVDLAEGGRWWVVTAPLGDAGRVLFARSAEEELAVLPRLRRAAAVAAGLALLLALLLGTLAARAMAHPVRALAAASERLAAGDFSAPVPRSSLSEVDLVGESFAEMRSALARRLEELQAANRRLEEQRERLQALQGELIQRDRLAASGRLVAELAHEIRNPVASVRNCLEVLDRRLAEDPDARVFTKLAIGELARMHELAEGLLDLNRPLDPDAAGCDAGAVAEQVAALMGAGGRGERWPVTTRIGVTGDGGPVGTEDAVPDAAIPPDALKQVLLNLVQNAQEAMPEGGPVEIRVGGVVGGVVVEVADLGTGIPADVLPRVFDPFFTTKGGVRGVGLGLFVAEGIVRRHGGALSAANRADGPGAVFRIELPAAGDMGADVEADAGGDAGPAKAGGNGA